MRNRTSWPLVICFFASGCQSQEGGTQVEAMGENCDILITTADARPGMLVEIDASACQIPERLFVSALKQKLSNLNIAEIRLLSLLGPGGEGAKSASEAWTSACGMANWVSRDTKSGDFVRAFADAHLGRSIAKLFVERQILFEVDSVDNFYPLKRKSAAILVSASCDASLLPPVIWFKRVPTK